MIFIKFKLTNTYNAFQRLLFFMLCILLSLSCLAQNKTTQTDEHPNINQTIDTTKTSLSFLKNPDTLSVSSHKTPEQLTDSYARIKDVEAKLNFTEMIKSYLKDRQLELKQLWNTYRTTISLRKSWIRSAGGCITITKHLLHLKKHSGTLPKLRPKLQCLCRSFPPSINTC